jgi:hypothetical protein
LACAADVHVITTQGDRPRSYHDGVFSVHELGTVDRSAQLRRDVVFGPTAPQPSTHALDALISEAFRSPWTAAAHHLARLAPAVVLVADHRQLGAVEVVQVVCGGVTTVAVPMLAAPRSSIAPVFAPGIASADSVICFTEQERRLCGDIADPARVHRVGVPLATNMNVLGEPEPRVAEIADYILVLTSAPLSELADPWLDLLTTRFASSGVVVSAANALVIHATGGAAPVTHIETTRHNDLLRFMAWARLTVDLYPGALFGRRSLESLLHGTAIVVPSDSSAREHADDGAGGLWFDDVSSLLWHTEALLDPALATQFAEQGRSYAHRCYGSRRGFVNGVADALFAAADGRRSVRDLAEEARRFADGGTPTAAVPSERGAR